MAKHGELAGKIWRTIVVAGAMLGAPLASADAQKPAVKVDASVELDAKLAAAVDAVVAAKTEADRKAATAKLEALRKERAAAATQKLGGLDKLAGDLRELDVKVAAAIEAVAKAQTDADRKAATQKLEALRKDKAELDKRVAAERAKASPVDQLAYDLQQLDVKVTAAVDAVVAAQTDADRKAAVARLDGLRKERAALAERVKAERAKLDAAKRPRAKDDERPVGRGFLLA